MEFFLRERLYTAWMLLFYADLVFYPSILRFIMHARVGVRCQKWENMRILSARCTSISHVDLSHAILIARFWKLRYSVLVWAYVLCSSKQACRVSDFIPSVVYRRRIKDEHPDWLIDRPFWLHVRSIHTCAFRIDFVVTHDQSTLHVREMILLHVQL